MLVGKVENEIKRTFMAAFPKQPLFCLEAMCKSPDLLIKRAAPAMCFFFKDLLVSVWCKMNVEFDLE